MPGRTMAEPLLDLCPNCGAHFTPRPPIKAKLDATDSLRSQLRREIERCRVEARDWRIGTGERNALAVVASRLSKLLDEEGK